MVDVVGVVDMTVLDSSLWRRAQVKAPDDTWGERGI